MRQMATDLCSLVVRSVIFLYVDRGCVESLEQWKLAKMIIEIRVATKQMQ